MISSISHSIHIYLHLYTINKDQQHVGRYTIHGSVMGLEDAILKLLLIPLVPFAGGAIWSHIKKTNPSLGSRRTPFPTHFLCKDLVHHPIDSQPFSSMDGCHQVTQVA